MMHVPETDLALFAAGDLARWQQLKVSIHVHRCDRCRALVDAYSADAEYLKSGAADLPPGVDWDRLSAEMSANIHLGLTAGEIVAQPKRRESINVWQDFWGWRTAAAAVGIVVLVGLAWWVNMPASTNQVLGRIVGNMIDPPDSRAVVVASPERGIEFRENGGVLGFADLKNEVPLAVTVSNTEASAQYMDEDTGQLVIATVYVE